MYAEKSKCSDCNFDKDVKLYAKSKYPSSVIWST